MAFQLRLVDVERRLEPVGQRQRVDIDRNPCAIIVGAVGDTGDDGVFQIVGGAGPVGRGLFVLDRGEVHRHVDLADHGFRQNRRGGHQDERRGSRHQHGANHFSTPVIG